MDPEWSEYFIFEGSTEELLLAARIVLVLIDDEEGPELVGVEEEEEGTASVTCPTVISLSVW